MSFVDIFCIRFTFSFNEYRGASLLVITCYFLRSLVAHAETPELLRSNDDSGFKCPVSVLSEKNKEDYYSGFPLHNDYLATHIYENGQIIKFKNGKGIGRIDTHGQLRFKHGWYRKVGGDFKVVGRRFDRLIEKPLRYIRPDFPTTSSGGMVGELLFPSPGCWEVTGYVDEHSLSFVVEVLYMDDASKSSSQSRRLDSFL